MTIDGPFGVWLRDHPGQFNPPCPTPETARAWHRIELADRYENEGAPADREAEIRKRCQ